MMPAYRKGFDVASLDERLDPDATRATSRAGLRSLEEVRIGQSFAMASMTATLLTLIGALVLEHSANDADLVGAGWVCLLGAWLLVAVARRRCRRALIDRARAEGADIARAEADEWVDALVGGQARALRAHPP